MADSLWMKLRKVSWEQYACNPGTSKKLPKMLENLASRKLPRAMKASHELWAALCAREIAPASVAALPFLFEILRISDPAVQSEIIDILLKLSNTPSEHQKTIQAELLKKKETILRISHYKEGFLAEKAKRLIASIL